MALLSIIIPFGTSKERPYIKERVIQKARKYKSNEKIEYIFVEGFSSLEHPELKSLIESKGHRYFKDEAQQSSKTFSLGQCRNLGIINAKSDVVMSLDVDCVISKRNLENILELIAIKEIDKNPNAFLVLPCIFLNELGTELYQNIKNQDVFFQNDLISGKREFVKFFMKASSSIIINRFKFLELGGYDEDFKGYGSEDFDFLARLLKNCAEFEALPDDLTYFAKNWDFNEFKGFRVWFSLVAEEAILHGIYIYHLWHIEPNQNKYFNNKELNHKKFIKNLQNKNHFIEPLYSNPLNLAKNLTLFKENSTSHRILNQISVFIGECIFKLEQDFFDYIEDRLVFNKQAFMKFLKNNQINNIILFNPYGNELRLEIYNFCKEQNIPYIIWERGAINDSWFFDTKGFNYDSTSYDEKLWNRNLSQEQILKTKVFIENELFNNENFLEKQGLRQNELELRRRLGIRHKKVIFVPLQVPSDTVIQYFSKPPFDYQGFLEIIDTLAKNFIKQDVVFIAKKHPLDSSLNKKAYNNLLFAPDDTHFLDLLQIAKACVLINSGVGLYALMMQKPCIICGGAFYACKDLNIEVKNKEELESSILSILNNGFKVDEAKMLRFLHYLIFEFYSFGKSYYKIINKQDRRVNAVVAIDFYQIIIKGKIYLQGTHAKKMTYKLNSPIYKPYIYEIKNIIPKQKSKNSNVTFIESKLYHTRFYRLARKLFTRPRDFIIDSKNPLIKPLKLFLAFKAKG